MLYRQFKITLLGIEPPVWRQIQVPDCTLDELHEYIQAAMGWADGHLHQFEIARCRYGDPELLDGGDGVIGFFDSTVTNLGELLAMTGASFRFFYDYDFGDNWRHEIIYEGDSSAEPDVRYPRCIDGARACPPDDCGGPPGYEDFLEAIRDPTYDDYKSMRRWIGGSFDPERFSPAAATMDMNRGLPNWRD